jgi:CHASE3 domain sensor protein
MRKMFLLFFAVIIVMATAISASAAEPAKSDASKELVAPTAVGTVVSADEIESPALVKSRENAARFILGQPATMARPLMTCIYVGSVWCEYYCCFENGGECRCT